MKNLSTRCLLLVSLGIGPTLLAQDVASTSAVMSQKRPADATTVTVASEGRTLDLILRDLEQQTSYTFVYSNELFRQLRPSLVAVRQPLHAVLASLLSPLRVAYQTVGNQIILSNADRVISGQVTDAKTGEGLPGVNVTIKSTNRGTTTDSQGNYRISLPEQSVTLVFSYVGYAPQEVAVGRQTNLAVQLVADERSLNEVQVVAFGEQRTRDLTGSFASVKAADIRLSTAVSPDVALQGRTPGVQITQAGGTPGGAVRINVRGVASINSNSQPLIVVDGVPILTGAFGAGGVAMNPLSEINPDDIESMEILKDASASVLFGSRAANGVLLITTKKGKKGKPRFDISYQEGVNTATNRIDLVDTGADYLNILKRSARNNVRAGLNPQSTNLVSLLPTGILRGTLAPALDPRLVDSTTLYNTQTNWLDQVLRQGRFRQATLGVSAGTNKLSAYVSGSYRGEDGILVGQSFQRVSGRTNVTYTPVRFLSMGVNLSANGIETNNVPINNSFRYALGGALPAYPVQLPDGSFFNGIANGTNNTISIGTNPVFFRNNYTDVARTFRSTNTGFLDIKPLPGLSIRTEAGYDYQRTRADVLQNQTLYPTGIVGAERGGNGRAENRVVTNRTFNLNNLVSYTRVLGKEHRLTVLAGNNLQSTRSDNATYITENVPEGAIRGLDTARSVVYDNEISFRFVSYFGRLNYAFRDRYLVEVSARTDGSSRFGPGNRWATFPGASVGWIISDEEFLRNASIINFLKLRASYGLTGNAEIGNFSWQKVFTYVGYNAAIYGGVQGGQFTSPGNRALGWESTRQLDLGADFRILGNRLTGTIDYYNKISDGLLLDYSLGPLAGTINNVMTINLGSVRNRGVEFSISSRNIERKNFRWSTDFNIARNENRVLSTYDAPFLNFPSQLVNGPNIATPGYPLGNYYMAQFAGFDPVTGNELFYERDRSVFANTGQTVRTGNLWDGTINNQAGVNQFILENRTPYPTFFGGLTNTVQVGRFDLSALIYFQVGNWIYDQGERAQSYPFTGQVLRQTIPGIGNVQQAIRQGDNTALDRLQWASNMRGAESTRFLHNGSFGRLKNVQIGYSLSPETARKLKLRSLRVTLTGQNLFTVTKFPGWDPEVFRNGGADGANANLSPGLTSNDLPQVKTYQIGLNVSF
ncbi:TonB-linked SusC/RagA family outer membrane protein [Spirosoma lacussanchae]|uniref:SusC/RagA family TonB-linked outer membrane protein n=1 Tax=Spirosoma lacussanchae TaxID=1884249 RepID=UPI00110900E2|nr:TonB-dependent receptor [Spirosoma lacussanchae]